MPYDLSKQSAQLTAFYKAYAEWLDKGAPDERFGNSFNRGWGLCSILYHYALDNNHSPSELINELNNQFTEAKIDRGSAFTNGDIDRYFAECHRREAHLNRERVAWVRNHIPS